MSQVFDDIKEEEEIDDTSICNGSGCEQEVLPEDPYFASPCGTYCSTCMKAHIEGCDICRGEFAEDFEDDEDEREADACNGENCKAEVQPEDPYYATPCGTFCSVCMRKHKNECEICRLELETLRHP